MRARRAIERVAPGRFLEVHVQADLALCARRDPKGLYRRARNGEIRQFTGLDAPYEAPESADLSLDTARRSVEDCVRAILGLLRGRGLLEGR
jgi:adenylylsulfate kinase-like enzyme